MSNGAGKKGQLTALRRCSVFGYFGPCCVCVSAGEMGQSCLANAHN